MSLNPEAQARKNIDNLLVSAWWVIQDMKALDIFASFGVAVREFPLEWGNGFVDYLLYVDGKAIGIIEAKKEWVTLTGVETQSAKYLNGIPNWVDTYKNPLPFSYESTGIETRFTNYLEPDARSREVFAFHRPETLRDFVKLSEQPLALLRILPPVDEKWLRKVQIEAIKNLETSLANNRSRALIQMATGTGKTFTFCNIAYRLIKHAWAKRILFLVDRGNLGRQTMTEFQNFSVPWDGRKFTELYNVQNLSSNKIDDVPKVTISTIQRMFSMISGFEMDEEMDEQSFESTSFANLIEKAPPIGYNPTIPIETFDYIVVDECHRSIYNLWRQVLEYFDAKLIGLTATPSKQTIGFFHNNLVMEYNHERAVADGINVDFDVYKIETQIGREWANVKAGYYIDKRDKLTRNVRYELLDDDLLYSAKDLDRSVVALDQIRTIIRTFRDKLPEIFPWRKEIPKTLIFAKDDSHADDIVKILREEFWKGNDFCQKITYKTTGKKPEDLIKDFKNDYNPRIAVTVDMIATGTDIKPLEIVFFMRAVKSQLLFEQMKGRGVRVIDDNDFRAVSWADETARKTHFVIIDAVGATELDRTDTKPLDKQPTVGFEKILKIISMGNTEPDILSTLVSRLSRVSKSFTRDQHAELEKISGISLYDVEQSIISAIDEDNIRKQTLAHVGKCDLSELTEEEISDTRKTLARNALKPFYNPRYREKLMEIKRDNEQIIDTVSTDSVVFSGFSADARKKAESLIQSFRTFIEENHEELALIKAYYSESYRSRVRLEDVKEFTKSLERHREFWGLRRLWEAYKIVSPLQVTEESELKDTDTIPLITFTLSQIDRLEPYRYTITTKYDEWIASQISRGIDYTPEQLEWLELMRDQIASSLSIQKEDFEYDRFAQKGWLGWVYSVFWNRLETVMEELNNVLVS